MKNINICRNNINNIMLNTLFAKKKKNVYIYIYTITYYIDMCLLLFIQYYELYILISSLPNTKIHSGGYPLDIMYFFNNVYIW